MQRTNSQTSTVVSESPSKKGKKKNAAAEEKVVVKPNNTIVFLPEMFVAEMQRRQIEATKPKASTDHTNLSVTEFLQQLRQSNDIAHNFFKVWTHNLIAKWFGIMSNGEGPSLFGIHEQNSVLVVFYVLCEFVKMDAIQQQQQQPAESVKCFVDWMRENSNKISFESVVSPWDFLLGALNKEPQVSKEPSTASTMKLSRRSRMSSMKTLSLSESRIRFGKQLAFYEDLILKTFRFAMHFEMLRQMVTDTNREWRDIESYDHRILGARPYWGKDARKTGKKSARTAEVEPTIKGIGSAEELLNEQRHFILPLNMAEEVTKEFFKILGEGPKKAEEESEGKS